MAWLVYGALGTNVEEEVVAKDAVGAAGGECAGVCPLAREPLKQQVVGRPALEVGEQMPLQRGQVRLTQDHAVLYWRLQPYAWRLQPYVVASA